MASTRAEQATLIASLIEPFPIHWVREANEDRLIAELEALQARVSADRPGIYGQLTSNAQNDLGTLVRLAVGADPRGGKLRDQLLLALSAMVRRLVALAQDKDY